MTMKKKKERITSSIIYAWISWALNSPPSSLSFERYFHHHPSQIINMCCALCRAEWRNFSNHQNCDIFDTHTHFGSSFNYFQAYFISYKQTTKSNKKKEIIFILCVCIAKYIWTTALNYNIIISPKNYENYYKQSALHMHPTAFHIYSFSVQNVFGCCYCLCSK